MTPGDSRPKLTFIPSPDPCSTARPFMPAITAPGEKPRKFLPPFWMVLCLALAWLLDRYAPLWSPELPALGLLGRVIALLGLGMILWPVMQFLLARTGLVPFSKATTLVTSGLYRVTRNPMYLGMVLLLLGAAGIFGSLGALLPVPLFVLIIQRRFILGEERFLEAAFGHEYRAYRKRVRRWI